MSLVEKWTLAIGGKMGAAPQFLEKQPFKGNPVFLFLNVPGSGL